MEKGYITNVSLLMVAYTKYRKIKWLNYMNNIRNIRIIPNLWAATQVVLKKQIAVLESHGDLSSVFEGLELRDIQLLDIAGIASLLKDLKSLLAFSLTRKMPFVINKAAA